MPSTNAYWLSDRNVKRERGGGSCNAAFVAKLDTKEEDEKERKMVLVITPKRKAEKAGGTLCASIGVQVCVA